MHNTRCTIAAGGMDHGLQSLEFSELTTRTEAHAPCALDFFVNGKSNSDGVDLCNCALKQPGPHHFYCDAAPDLSLSGLMPDAIPLICRLPSVRSSLLHGLWFRRQLLFLTCGVIF